MSYNYDLNPWDDNYATNSQSSQQQAGANNAPTSGYATGAYTNPMDFQAGGYGSDAVQGQPSGYGGQQAESEQFIDRNGEQQEPSKQPESACKRFLRAHVPFCGPCLDITSAIHIPFLDTLLKFVNRDLLVSKVFYFFFYSAFGSLFPLMGVYFKQLGMNPAQVGILTGVRPFIEIFSAPFWNSLAERFKKAKALLLFSLFCWIVFTHSLAHIRPPASACVAFNDTDYVLYVPYSDNDLSNYEIGQTDKSGTGELTEGKKNEMFLNKMPDEKETEILASEENENVQGRRKRRRRKRQVDDYIERPQPAPLSRPSAARYTYSIDGLESANNDKSYDGYESHLDLNVDLENDFADTLIDKRPQGDRRGSLDEDAGYQIGNSFNEVVEDPSASESNAESDGESGQRSSMRYKRNIGGGGDEDYASNEPQEDSQERAATDEEEWNRYGGDEAKMSKGRQNEMNNGEDQGNDVDESGESEAADYESNNNGNNKNKKVSTKHNHQRLKGSSTSSGSTTTSASTTTTSTPAPKVNSESTSNNNRLSDGEEEEDGVGVSSNRTKKIYKQRHKTPPTHIVGMSPITVEYAVNYNKEKHGQFVTPMFSTIVYKLDDIKEVFFLLLLLISLGEFFSAPAITIADSITLSYLGESTDLYGRQRMFGSFGWAITLLLVGMALDNSTTIADHPCGPHQRERSYTVCFAIFSLLMACAFFTATQFKFNYQNGNKSGKNGNDGNAGDAGGGGGQALITRTTDNNNVVTTTLDGQTVSSNIDDVYGSTQPRNIFNTAPPVNAPPPGSNQQAKEKFEFLDKWKSAVFASRTRDLPEWVNVFRQFKDPLNLTYLFITWFLGCGVGLVFTFLFWHLQDVGGTPTLFGICSVINHISEILAYFFSSNFIKRFGHTKVLSIGLGCNVIRFIYVAFLSNPYYALPFELVQGITHAACFAACCSYISHVSKPELRTSTQGVMQGLHHGIGRASGTLLGGYLINAIGSRASFCLYGLLSGCVLAGFLYVRKRASSQVTDEEVKIDDSEALGGYGAPQGVPSAIPSKIAQSVPQQDIDYQW